MRWTRLLAALVALPLAARPASAQGATGRITGVITERESGRPVGDANIVVVGTRFGTRSTDDGRYTLGGLAAGRYVLRVARIGFTAVSDTVDVAAGQTVTHDIALHQVSVALNEMVVVGYGSQRRSDLTGSVASVTPSVETTPTTSMEQTLQGTAPGVQVTTASSAPGGGISIRIRGGSSLNGSNEPLYVIDGFPVENDPEDSSPSDGGRDATVVAPANPLATLNPSDIASIEILKDASATSIYGARGANGVVIITTKHGSSGAKPRVTLDSYVGWQNVAKRYDLLNGPEFANFANEWAQAQTTPSTPFPDVTAVPNTDWQSQIFRQGLMNNLQLGVTGGSPGANGTQYALSGGSFNQVGVVKGSDFRRLSMRGSLTQTIASRLHLGSNLLVSRVNSNQVPTDGSFNAGAGAVGAALQYIPIMPVTQSDGSYSLASTDYPTVLSSLGLTGGNIPNPVATALLVQDRLADTRLLANATGDYSIIDGLVFRVNLGGDLSDRTRDTYYPSTTLQGLGQNGRAIRGDVKNSSWLQEYTLNWDRAFGAIHRVSAVGGYTRQKFTSIREGEQNSNFVNDITGYENIGAGTVFTAPTSGHTQWTLASYLGRLNYTLLDRYLFTLTGREDGSSRFGAAHRWGFFPSAAFGWRVSEEPFLRNVKSLDQLKLRVSYGLAGNPSIRPYQSMTTLSAVQYAFNGNSEAAYYPSTLGNDKLSWETTRQTDVGMDLGLWASRLEATVDYYAKRTNDLLLQINLPTESGFSSAFVNAGSIQNNGIELGLTLRPFIERRPGGFSWTTTFNVARNRNRVIDLGGVDQIFATSTNSDIKSTGTLVQVGQPIGVFYGYKTNGIFRDSAAIVAYNSAVKTCTCGNPTLGGTRFVDVNGDSVIDANDRTIIGDPNPKFTGGWQNTIGWHGFELSGLFDGSYGNKVFNLNLYRAEQASPSGNVLRDRVTNAWTPTNPNGKYPKIGSGLGFLSSDFTDQLIEDGSYLRLRNVTLTHDIPSRWLGGHVDMARLFVSGQNLYTWTHYSGFNPDVSSEGVGNLNRGIDIGAYPLARTWTFGVNLSY